MANKFTYEDMQLAFDNFLKANKEVVYTGDEGAENRFSKVQQALDTAGLGDKDGSKLLKSIIKDFLVRDYGINSKTINSVLSMNKLSVREKYEIILYKYGQKFGGEALYEMIVRHNLQRYRIDETGSPKYFITEEDIDNIYDNANFNLSFEEKLDIVTIILYSDTHGLGVQDTNFNQNIDGVSGGVSGVPQSSLVSLSLTKEEYDKLPKGYDSVWCYVRGKQYHLEFLSYGSFEELSRIVKRVVEYNPSSQLTTDEGFKYTTMADASRVISFVTPLAEENAFFIRKKYKLELFEPEELIKGDGSECVIEHIKYLFKGLQHTAICGPQGTGKTTLLICFIRYFYSYNTLRVFEGFFETQLRLYYTKRNIFTLQPHGERSSKDCLDGFKKTDAVATILGEIADNPSSAHMVELTKVSSPMVAYTNHSLTMESLISSHSDALMAEGLASDNSSAEEAVIKATKFMIRPANDGGNRYIEYIDECIPVKIQAYPDRINTLMDYYNATLTYYKLTTRGSRFSKNRIIEYDIDKKRYVLTGRISDERIKEIYANLSEEDRVDFKRFLKKYYGKPLC